MAARHMRTAVGVVFMLLGAVSVIGARWLEPGRAACATSWVEVVQHYGFPSLLFLGGLALFNREAFGDIVGTAKSMVRRRRSP